jgi:hypothetical protein
MPPGRYTVKLTVDGQSFSQPLEVRKDPNETVSDQDLKAAADQLMAVQNELNASADVLNTIETVRVQVGTLKALIASDRSNADLNPAADSLEQKFIALEQNLIDPRMTGRGQDGVRWPIRLGGQLGYLAGGIATSDFAPTAQQKDVHAGLEKQVRDNRITLEQLIQRDLNAFNNRLRAKGLKAIEVVLPPIVF